MNLKIVSAPTGEPLTLLEAAQHLRVADTVVEADQLPDKALIIGLISAARQTVENYTRRQLREGTYELTGNVVHRKQVVIPKHPLVKVNAVSYVGYEDVNGAQIEVEVTTNRITHEVFGGSFLNEEGGVLEYGNESFLLFNMREWGFYSTYGYKVNFTAGYREAPEALKSAMKLIIGHLYENREDVVIGAQANSIPNGAKYLMDPYRIYL